MLWAESNPPPSCGANTLRTRREPPPARATTWGSLAVSAIHNPVRTRDRRPQMRRHLSSACIATDSTRQMQPPLVLRRYEAASVGVTRHALESLDWQHVSHGLYAAPGTLEYLPRHRAALLRVLPTSSALAHVTGAAIRGWPLPWLPPHLPVFACCPATGTHVQRGGTYVSRLAGRPIDEIHGLPVLSTPVLLLDLARDLELVDLTAVVDGALRMEGVEAETVLKALPARAHGGPRLRRALAYCDPKAESPRETALRLLHTLAGITQVESQVNVGGADGPVGRADLWLVGTRRLVEYDGAEHRRKQRQRRDLVRDRKLHRTHWGTLRLLRRRPDQGARRDPARRRRGARPQTRPAPTQALAGPRPPVDAHAVRAAATRASAEPVRRGRGPPYSRVVAPDGQASRRVVSVLAPQPR